MRGHAAETMIRHGRYMDYLLSLGCFSPFDASAAGGGALGDTTNGMPAAVRLVLSAML